MKKLGTEDNLDEMDIYEENTLKLSPELHKQRGLKIDRLYTKKGTDVYSMFRYELRDSVIRNPDGSIVSEMKNIEVPADWSQMATDILAQKYLRKKGVPQHDEKGNPILDSEGKPLLGSEKSIKQVIKRLSKCWRHWGEKFGYFETQEDADAFEDEIAYMLLAQIAAPNSPQWFNTGLHLMYGITGPAQGHYYVDHKTGEVKASTDAYSRPQVHACFILSLKDDLVNQGGIFDLVMREARIFKYGSGTGTNFSSLRAIGEPLSGGGVSSGLMSFLKIFDRAAGAIKSGGTTRRAAKMVCLDADHPEVIEFIEWKHIEEQKVAALVAGGATLKELTDNIYNLVSNGKTIKDKELRSIIRTAKKKGIPLNYIKKIYQSALLGKKFEVRTYNTNYEGEAYLTVSGQNSNNSIRLSHKFMDALEVNGDWHLTRRTDGKISKTLKAKDLWDKIVSSAWSCADPGLQFDDTINEWHTCPASGKINASNPCSEYMFLDDTACNLASINLIKFYEDENGLFDVERFKHACRLWTIVLDISVGMAEYPSYEMAKKSYEFRTLGLGYANLGALLMTMGIPYDSEEGRAICGAITSIMCGTAYETSAEMAKLFGPFPQYEKNSTHMLRVIRNHRRAAYNSAPNEYEGLRIKPMGINPSHCPTYLLKEARYAWDRALSLGEKYGFRNAQTTVIAPTGTIGLVMDCDTTGIEPDFALVKFKKLSGGGYFKIINSSLPKALKNLGYSEQQIKEIVEYCIGRGTFKNAPYINHQTLKAKGFTDREIEIIEAHAKNAFDIRFIFSSYTLGSEFFKSLNIPEEKLSAPYFDLLKELGFKEEEIEAANEYVCGAMTIEGAPHLKQEHYPIFDCANRCGKKGKRFIHYSGHIKMMAAAQPFISGSISKTINLPSDASIQDVSDAYLMAYTNMLKCIAIYRDGSKLSQPLVSKDDELSAELYAIGTEEEDVNENVSYSELQKKAIEQTQPILVRRRLPPKRRGFIQEATIGGQKVYLRTGEYPDGTLGEIFIDMYKEGASYRSLLNCFAVAVSKALQYGVPLEEFVDSFTFTRFEPSGNVTGHHAIKRATSILDYVFRVLGYEYLNRTDLAHSLPEENNTPGITNVELKKNAQNNPEPKTQREKPTIQKQEEAMKKTDEYKSKGYTGDMCQACGSMHVKRSGTCSVCEDCGTTSGCS